MNRGGLQFLDNVLSPVRRNQVYQFVINSHYRIGWGDTSRIELSGYRYLHSTYSKEDANNLGLLNDIKGTEIENSLEGLEYEKTVVNLSMPSDVHWPHIHTEQVVMLYYANLDWLPEWYGETMFYQPDMKNVIMTLPYTPGRILVFDAEIPHCIKPQSFAAPNYRFTVATIFNRPKIPTTSP